MFSWNFAKIILLEWKKIILDFCAKAETKIFVFIID